MNNKPIVRLRSLQVSTGKLSRVGNAFLPTTQMSCNRWAKKPAHPAYLLHSQAAHQSGAVLIISLIMLLLLTLIGTAAMQSTSLEEKMAGNMRDRNLAFQAAESALSSGESWLRNNTFTCSAAAGRFMPMDKDCDAATVETIQVWDNINWNNSDSVLYAGALSNLNANPRYIIESMGASCASVIIPCPAADVRNNYRVTARATGGSTNAVVILQSIYSPP